MQFPETIETARLILRRWREEDAPACFHYASDPRVGPLCGWLPHESEEYSRQIIRTILSAAMNYAVTVKGSDEAIGSIGFHPANNEACRGHLEMGYWLGAPHWGNGYIPEAAQALMDFAFTLPEVDELWVAHYAENHNSRRVIKKLGFTFRFQCEEAAPLLGKMKELWYYSKSR